MKDKIRHVWGNILYMRFILLSSLHAFFKMSDSEVVLSILALFLAIPCIYQAVFAAIPKYGFLFYVWVCSASEPVLSTSFFIREKSCSYVHQKGWKKKVQCEWRGSGLHIFPSRVGPKSKLLGHPKQRKCKFVLMKSLCSGCPSGQLALQHGGFCTM